MTALAICYGERRNPLTRAFLLSAKNKILGARYELSVAFISSREMRRLNKMYRGADVPTDVLSFSLGADAGEILLCASEARKHSPSFGRTSPDFLQFLFIHALVHLKGYQHGATMECEEEKFRKKFSI